MVKWTKERSKELRAQGNVEARRLNAMVEAGQVHSAPRPIRMDTGVFLEQVEDKLWQLFQALDGQAIQKMEPREIVTGINILIEKRNLLRGEPTSIVSSGNRGSVEKVSALLLAELTRRGLDMTSASAQAPVPSEVVIGQGTDETQSAH